MAVCSSLPIKPLASEASGAASSAGWPWKFAARWAVALFRTSSARLPGRTRRRPLDPLGRKVDRLGSVGMKDTSTASDGVTIDVQRRSRECPPRIASLRSPV